MSGGQNERGKRYMNQKTKDEGIAINERGISRGAHDNETECCSGGKNGSCYWHSNIGTRDRRPDEKGSGD